MRASLNHVMLGIALWSAAISPSSVFAVVTVAGDGSGNTMAPTDDPGFANVVRRGSDGAIYVGSGWALTPAALGVGSVTFDGIEYSPIADSEVRIQNAAGVSKFADIVMFQLDETPPLPSLRLGCESAAVGDEVIMIGHGRKRQPDLTFWKVEQLDGLFNDIWTPVENFEESNVRGYLTDPDKELRWGTNRISSSGFAADAGLGETLSFATTFNEEDGTEFEAQVVGGDSGGAVFHKNGSIWELAGMIFALEPLDNQPDFRGSAVFESRTFSVDLHAYADQLRAVADFEAAPGDFDGNGRYTADDIDLLQAALREGEINCHLDLHADGQISDADLDVLLGLAETLPGDTDLSGAVGFNDFLRLADHFGGIGGWGEGDFSGDQRIEFNDFLELASNFGSTFKPGQPSMAAAIPEPASWLGLMIGVLSMYAITARRNRC